MHIKELNIAGIRNLKQTKFVFSPHMNIFYGNNGSGKTSLLEAIHVLGAGRSFRANQLQQIIQFGLEKYTVSAVISDGESLHDLRVGTEKRQEIQKASFAKDGDVCKVSVIAELLPLHLLDCKTVELLIGGPSLRRNFIDSGMFHVEHSFLEASSRFRRCLAQRNAELKSDIPFAQKRKQVEAWNELFIDSSMEITVARERFLVDFIEIFNKSIKGWKYSGRVSFQYKNGWGEEQSIKQAVENSALLDLSSGITNRGPHRAELEIFIDGSPAKTILSRGQQKAFSCAMVLAKAELLKLKAEKSSIFLVDDLHSELDERSFSLVFNKLIALDGQIFVTGIEKDRLLRGLVNNFKQVNYKLFHVEQFAIRVV